MENVEKFKKEVIEKVPKKLEEESKVQSKVDLPPKSKEKPTIEQPIKSKSPQKVAPVEEQKS